MLCGSVGPEQDETRYLKPLLVGMSSASMAMAVEQHQGRHAGESVSLHSAKLLVVDDNRELLHVLNEILSRQGFEVLRAETADQALKTLTTVTPDLIVCDVMLPGKDGYALLHEVRQHPEWAELPFIFLTSLGGREDVYNGKERGCDDYLTKPFDPDELVAVIRGKLTLAEHRKRLSRNMFEGYRKRIIHTLSHEFRTPLVSINTGTELLLDQQHSLGPDQIKRLLESIQRGGYRLERLVNDFMLMQQIDLGHAASSCQRFRRKQPFLYLVESSIESFQEGFPRSQRPENIRFTVLDDAASERAVDVYDVQIAHVIQHLLSNALKFGGDRQPIEVSVASAPSKLVLRIRDHGPGMEGAHTDRACELFSQINRDMNEQQGAGLGLTICRYFTKINDGQIQFRSPDDGSGLVAELQFETA